MLLTIMVRYHLHRIPYTLQNIILPDLHNQFVSGPINFEEPKKKVSNTYLTL